MTNKEIFESLKTAKWQRVVFSETTITTQGDGWAAAVHMDGSLHIAGGVGGAVSFQYGVIPAVDEVVKIARYALADFFYEWLEK
jgi:cytoskeletal protein CcmA (bactofilin family)